MSVDTVRRRVTMRTLGCKVNSYESEQILQRLVSGGKWQAAGDEESDLCIINSCTVTREADRQTRQEIRRCIRENPNAKIVVTGCYAEMSPAEIAEIDGVDLVVGNAQKLKIPFLLPQLESGELPKVLSEEHLDDKLLTIPDPLLSGYSERTRAFLQIQQGCNQGCTFCIIHQARGESRSLSLEGIVSQAKKLHIGGFEEIVLCGVDLGSYGQDLSSDGEITLVTLIQALLNSEANFKIRIGSLDPVHISDDLLQMIAMEERLAPHLHISVQSAHTLILKRMKRRYDREFLYDRVSKAHSLIDDLIIGADIMAGFPTEEDDHFMATLNAVHDLRIAFPHVFPYSERPGTPAARIPRQVKKDVRSQRASRIRDAGRVVLAEELEKRVGQVRNVLVERSASDSKNARGRLTNYLPVNLNDSTLVAGSWINTRITGHNGQSLDGETGK